MVRVVDWSAEEGHDFVADVFVNRSLFALNRVAKRAQVVVERGDQLLGATLLAVDVVDDFRELGEFPHVAEERGELLVVAADLRVFWVLDDLLYDFRRDIGAELGLNQGALFFI